MIITTTNQIQDSKIIQTFELNMACIMADLRNLVCNNILEYTQLLTQSRKEALKTRTTYCSQWSTPIAEMKFMTSMAIKGATEILEYGTTVLIKH